MPLVSNRDPQGPPAGWQRHDPATLQPTCRLIGPDPVAARFGPPADPNDRALTTHLDTLRLRAVSSWPRRKPRTPAPAAPIHRARAVYARPVARPTALDSPTTHHPLRLELLAHKHRPTSFFPNPSRPPGPQVPALCPARTWCTAPRRKGLVPTVAPERPLPRHPQTAPAPLLSPPVPPGPPVCCFRPLSQIHPSQR